MSVLARIPIRHSDLQRTSRPSSMVITGCTQSLILGPQTSIYRPFGTTLSSVSSLLQSRPIKRCVVDKSMLRAMPHGPTSTLWCNNIGYRLLRVITSSMRRWLRTEVSSAGSKYALLTYRSIFWACLPSLAITSRIAGRQKARQLWRLPHI